MLRVWNLSLVCATFSLTILGTFITRSGVIVSVHAFANGAVGPLILAFFAFIVLVVLGLIFWRGDRLRAPGSIDSPVSREGAFLANNLLFAAFAFIVLLGTVFPLIVEALQDKRISVGRPYFERMTTPIGIAMLFLMAVAPALPWRKASGELLRTRLEWPAWFGTGSLVLALAVGARGLLPLLAFAMAGFAGGAALRQLVLATRRQGWRGLVGRANGGMIVHLGVIVMAFALAASNAYLRQGEFEFTSQGETAQLGDTIIEFDRFEELTFSNRVERRAVIIVDGTELTPAQNLFVASGQVVQTPSTRSSFTSDIQTSLRVTPDNPGDPLVIQVTEQPLITWLWVGGIMMLVGSVLSAFPSKRQRRPTDPVSAPIPGGVGADPPDGVASTSDVSSPDGMADRDGPDGPDGPDEKDAEPEPVAAP